MVFKKLVVSLVMVVFIIVIFAMVVFVIPDCRNMHNTIVLHGATAAEALISSSAVV